MSARTWIAATVVIGVVSELIYYLYNYKKKMHQQNMLASSARDKMAALQSDVFHSVLFFPDPKRTCPEHFWSKVEGCRRPSCPFSHEVTNFSRMVGVMVRAEKSFDVCVYTISNNDLAELVCSLHERGVVVRIITDDEAINMSGTYIGMFRRKGIQVRCDYSSYLMHHKFVIVDGTVLINGSLNWTCNAINSNNENVLMTNNSEIVLPFIEEFEKLWMLYDPANRPT